MFTFLLIFSLSLMLSDTLPLLKNYSFILTIVGITLFTGTLVYEFFDPKNYVIGALFVSILTILTILSKIDKYSAYRIWFLLAGILTILFIFLPIAYLHLVSD